MSSLGSGYLYPPISGGAYGVIGMGAITYDLADPKTADKPVKEQEAIHRPYITSGAGQWPGYGLFPVSLNLYYCWAMRRYPMVCKVMARLGQPIMAGTRSIEIIDDGGDEELANKIKAAAERALLPILAKAVPGALETPCFGNWLQELVWGTVRPDAKIKRIDPLDVRPVLPYERVLHVNEFRQFTGYQVMAEYRDARYGFLSVCQPHMDPVLGYSLNEGALTAYVRATRSAENADAMERKASGIQLLMHIMQGTTFTDPVTGKVLDYATVAQLWMDAAVSGNSVIVPAMAFKKEAIERNPELAKVPLVNVDRFDWGNQGPMMEAHLSRQRDLDVQICSAWGVPERAVMEADSGGIGTSDAAVHSDVVLLIAENWHTTICNQWDEQVTARWMDANFPDSGITIKTVPAPLADPQQLFLQEASLAIINDPVEGPKLLSNIDSRKLAERVEFPVVSEEDAKKALADRQAADKAEQARQDKQLAMKNKGNPNAQ